jgi:hypothetical protein
MTGRVLMMMQACGSIGMAQMPQVSQSTTPDILVGETLVGGEIHGS